MTPHHARRQNWQACQAACSQGHAQLFLTSMSMLCTSAYNEIKLCNMQQGPKSKRARRHACDNIDTTDKTVDKHRNENAAEGRHTAGRMAGRILWQFGCLHTHLTRTDETCSCDRRVKQLNTVSNSPHTSIGYILPLSSELHQHAEPALVLSVRSTFEGGSYT